MTHTLTCSVLLLTLLAACTGDTPAPELPTQLGRFQVQRDLFLAHFDVKTDVDDIHSVAAVATMLADPRLAGVNYHAVAGAYGMQDGLYVPANEVFEQAFGAHWSDAHADREQALDEVSILAQVVLASGGRVWIAEGGQSDFSAALVRELQRRLPEVDLKDRIHLVQHADWNEAVTTPADLAFVRDAATYHRIPDGNAVGNGTPGFRSDQAVDWQQHITDPRLRSLWDAAIAVAHTYNGADDRYLNASVKQGGLDFSDAIETAWIFGLDELVDAEDFFRFFATRAPNTD